MRKPKFTFLSLIFSIMFVSSTFFAQTQIGPGEVSGIWDADTVFVSGDISVPVNESLTISPGVVIYFTGEFTFDIYGSLNAEGTEQDSIFFRSDSLGEISSYPYYKGFWYGIVFHSTANTNQPTSILNYCNIKYAFPTWVEELSDRAGGGLVFYNSNVNVSHTSITDCYEENLDAGVFSVFNSEGVIDSLAISKTNTYSAGSLTLINSNIEINGLSIIGGFGTYFENSEVQLNNAFFSNCLHYIQYGVVNFKNSDIEMVNCEITDNSGIGIYSQFSQNTIRRTLIANNALNGAILIESPTEFFTSEIISNGAGGLLFQSSQDWETIFTSRLNNCLIAKNNGIGLQFTVNNNAYVTNCTIADNNYTNGWGGVSNGTPDTYLQNCIVYNNGNDLDFQAGGLYTYSIIQGNYVGQDTSSTNLDNVDPLFRDAANGDYHLQSISCGFALNSPGIDTGVPQISDFVLDCESAGLGTIASDIGAYGGADNQWDISVPPTEVERNENSTVADKFLVMQNYPNPFSKGSGGNPTTTINYAIPNSVEKNHDFSLQHVTLIVYDILGREVATLVNERQTAGNYSVRFNASKLTSGIYFYTLHAGDFTATRKMILMK